MRRRRILVRLLIIVGVLGALVIGAAAWLNRALPRIAATEIGRLMNARLEMGKITLRRNGSVSVAGLVVRPKQAEPLYDNTILRADNVYAKFSRRSLLRLSPQVTEIRVEDFLLDVQLNLDTARWNIGTLGFNAAGGGGGGLPALSLQRGKLRYCKVSGVQQEVVMSIPIEARFGRDLEADPSYGFEIKTAKLSGGYGDSRLSGRWRPGLMSMGSGHTLADTAELTLAGGLSSTDIPSLERAWAVDMLAGELKYDREGNYSLTLNMSGLHGKHAPEVDTLRFFAPAAAGAEPLRSLQEFFAEYQPTGTVGSLTLKASGNTKRWNESQIEGKVVCTDLSVCDSDFPYPLDHLRGEVEFTQSMVRVKQLVGQHGRVEVCIDGWTKGLGQDQQYQYQITSPNMILDQAVYAALKPEEKHFWDAFHPTGTVAADYRQTRTSPTDRRWTLSVNLNDVAAAFEEFPYPLTGLTGTLVFDRTGILLSDVVSHTGGKQIRVNGRVTEPSSETPACYISIDAKDIPLDGILREALPAQQRVLFRQFDVNGLADVRARVFSTPAAAPGAVGGTNAVAPTQLGTPATRTADPDREIARAVARGPVVAASASVGADNAGAAMSRRISFLADVSCKKGALKLPGPRQGPDGQGASGAAPTASAAGARAAVKSLGLSDITAEMTVTPDSLSVQRLEGRYDRSPVTITGGLRFGAGDKLRECHLKIAGPRVALDEAMLGLLPPALAPQLAAFHPTGDVGLVVDLQKADSNAPLTCAVVVDCLGDRVQHDRFPYPLCDIRGTISFANDEVVLANMTARPEETGIPDSELRQIADANPQSAIRIDGSLMAAGGKLDRGSFTLQATDLRFTESLGRALPKVLAGLYRELSPQGPFDLAPTTCTLSPGVGEETLVELRGQAQLGSLPRSTTAEDPPRPCVLRISGTAVELSGNLEAGISYSTKRGLNKGRAQLAAERLVVQGKTITRAGIDAVYDPNARKWTATNFVGDCYGGKLLGNLEIRLPESKGQPSSVPRPPFSGLEYQLQVALRAVDLQQFLLAGKPEDGGEKADDRGQKREGSDFPPSVLRPPSLDLSSTSAGTMDASLSLRARIGDSKRDQSPSEIPAERPPARGPEAPGDGSRPLGRQGICRVDIANMQVGKVSPLGQVLSMLRLNEPTDYTFEHMLIDSYIRGDKLVISKLDLSGRHAALVGAGTMDLPTDEINLTLTERGLRPAAAEPSVFRSLTEGLGGAVMRIEVTGKADSPRVRTRTLPVIEDSLRILGTPEENKKGKN